MCARDTICPTEVIRNRGHSQLRSFATRPGSPGPWPAHSDFWTHSTKSCGPPKSAEVYSSLSMRSTIAMDDEPAELYEHFDVMPVKNLSGRLVMTMTTALIRRVVAISRQWAIRPNSLWAYSRSGSMCPVHPE